ERLGVKRCAATATDGRMLLHAEWDEADPRDYPPLRAGLDGSPVVGFRQIVGVKGWVESLRECKAHRAKPILGNVLLDENGPGSRMGSTNLDREAVREHTPLVGSFAPYRDGIPAYRVGHDAVEITLNPSLLASLLDAMADCLGEGLGGPNPSVRLTVPVDWRKPLRIDAENGAAGRTLTGVIMPIHPTVEPKGVMFMQRAHHLQSLMERVVRATLTVDVAKKERLLQDVVMEYEQEIVANVTSKETYGEWKEWAGRVGRGEEESAPVTIGQPHKVPEDVGEKGSDQKVNAA
ncbi:MAG: hypothetical protein AAB262_12230, partial [Elusimicrobiota bacterium]